MKRPPKQYFHLISSRVEAPCTADHQLKKDDFEVVGDLAPQIVLKCPHSAKDSHKSVTVLPT